MNVTASFEWRYPPSGLDRPNRSKLPRPKITKFGEFRWARVFDEGIPSPATFTIPEPKGRGKTTEEDEEE
jgi:hypothetical protein